MFGRGGAPNYRPAPARASAGQALGYSTSSAASIRIGRETLK